MLFIRCDLIICVNGKTEKIASGLVQPFLDHLKTAQDQLAKGGYSIILEPGIDAAWFTKGTFERFTLFSNASPQLFLYVIYYRCSGGSTEFFSFLSHLLPNDHFVIEGLNFLSLAVLLHN